jgi:hypothetical protein
LLSTGFVTLNLRGDGFAPRHLKRWTAQIWRMYKGKNPNRNQPSKSCLIVPPKDTKRHSLLTITLRVGFSSAAQPINGREGETVVLLLSFIFILNLRVAVSPHVISAVRCFFVNMKRTSFLNLILLLLLAFNVACAQNTQSKKLVTPDGWKKIEACGLSFYVPPDLEEVKVQGIDSCVKEYRSKNILLSLDVLGYIGKESNSRRDEYSDKKDFQIVVTKVDRRKAEIITHYETENSEQWKDFPYSATLYIPVIRKEGGNLTIWTNSKSAEDRETAKKIFATVSFDK